MFTFCNKFLSLTENKQFRSSQEGAATNRYLKAQQNPNKMKNIRKFRVLILVLFSTFISCSQNIESTTIENGDIIFQTSLSNQSKAIQVATNSKYSHCGIVFIENDTFYVFEAIQPVKKTELKKWIKRGENGKYVIKRLKESDKILTPEVLNKMQKIGNSMTGKNYDLTFEWNDTKIYCSELIWKIFNGATGLEIGKLQQLKDFDLSNTEVQKIMKKRYGNKIPWNEKVISPVAIFESDLLKTVSSN